MTASPWAFEFEPSVVLLVVGLAGAYAWAARSLGPRLAPRPEAPVSRRQAVTFGGGVASLWLALGWPMHGLAEDYLYSAHMAQHLVLGLISAPLLVSGTPGWMVRALFGRGFLFGALRFVSRPLVAFLVYNVAIVLIHWPTAVQWMSDSEPIHGMLHLVMLAAGLVMWMPILSPVAEIPRLAPPANLLYLFLHSILPTVPASFLTFGKTVLYKHYESVPRLWDISAIADQQVAGLMMKIGAGFLMWGMIAVLFFAWQAEDEPGHRPDELDFDELQLELTRMGTTA